MMALVLIALAVAPMLVAFWVGAWLVGDLFANPVASPVRARSGDDGQR
jgi:hypothetical protein